MGTSVEVLVEPLTRRILPHTLCKQVLASKSAPKQQFIDWLLRICLEQSAQVHRNYNLGQPLDHEMSSSAYLTVLLTGCYRTCLSQPSTCDVQTFATFNKNLTIHGLLLLSNCFPAVYSIEIRYTPGLGYTGVLLILDVTSSPECRSIWQLVGWFGMSVNFLTSSVLKLGHVAAIANL